MTATEFLLVVILVWVLVGLVASFVMARRGHDPWSWGALGAVFGPLVVPLVLSASRREPEARAGAHRVAEGRPGTGPIDVLAAVDGSPESCDAAAETVAMLGSRLGRLTVAVVVDYDAVQAGKVADALERDAEQTLADACDALAEVEPSTVVLVGRPVQELAEYAQTQGFDLIVVGRRGRGLSRAALGSVAVKLAHGSPVPVLVGGAHPR